MIIDCTLREVAGTIFVSTAGRWLYYVLEDRKVIRYPVAVGNAA